MTISFWWISCLSCWDGLHLRSVLLNLERNGPDLNREGAQFVLFMEGRDVVSAVA